MSTYLITRPPEQRIPNTHLLELQMCNQLLILLDSVLRILDAKNMQECQRNERNSMQLNDEPLKLSLTRTNMNEDNRRYTKIDTVPIIVRFVPDFGFVSEHVRAPADDAGI